MAWTHTSLSRASVAVRLSAGSIARRVSIRTSAEGGKSLNVSAIQRLYDCCGLKIVACGNFDFFQYSSDGEPHNLKILCSCSTLREEHHNGNKTSIDKDHKLNTKYCARHQ